MSAPGKAQIKSAAPAQDLWQIAEAGDLDQLEKVLARGADVNACNDFGVTPLMVAAYHGRPEMVRALLEHGAQLNAVDNDGFTAAMLADDAGHDEIVRTLVSLGVKRRPTPHATETLPNRSAQNETFDEATDPDMAPTGRGPKVRTLHEPPEIWDLVHETRSEFNPSSALVGHLTSLRALVLAAMLLTIAGGAVFWFMRSRDSSVSPPATAPVQGEGSNTKTVTIPQPAETSRTAPSSDHPSNSTPARTDTADSSVDVPKPDIAAPAAASGSEVVAKPRRQNPTSSTSAKNATVAGTLNKDRSPTRGLFENDSATVARPDNKDTRQASTSPGSKSDKEKNSNPTATKKEADKALSPQPIAPAKANPTPKAKVIQWP